MSLQKIISAIEANADGARVFMAGHAVVSMQLVRPLIDEALRLQKFSLPPAASKKSDGGLPFGWVWTANANIEGVTKLWSMWEHWGWTLEKAQSEGFINSYADAIKTVEDAKPVSIKLTTLESEVIAMRDKTIADLLQQKRDLITARALDQKSIETLGNTVKSFQDKIKVRDKTIADQEEKLIARDKTIRELRDANSFQQSYITEQAVIIRTHENNIKNLQQHIESRDKNIVSLERDIELRDKTIAALQDQLSDSRGQDIDKIDITLEINADSIDTQFIDAVRQLIDWAGMQMTPESVKKALLYLLD